MIHPREKKKEDNEYNVWTQKMMKAKKSMNNYNSFEMRQKFNSIEQNKCINKS